MSRRGKITHQSSGPTFHYSLFWALTFCFDFQRLAALSLPEAKEAKDTPRQRSGSRVFRSSPSPITLGHPGSGGGATAGMTGSSTPESTTPTGRSTRRSFWDILVRWKRSLAN